VLKDGLCATGQKDIAVPGEVQTQFILVFLFGGENDARENGISTFFNLIFLKN